MFTRRQNTVLKLNKFKIKNTARDVDTAFYERVLKAWSKDSTQSTFSLTREEQANKMKILTFQLPSSMSNVNPTVKNENI